MDRYATSEDEFEPGSDGRVLRNRRGIVEPAEVGRIESALLALAQSWSFGRIAPDTTLSVALVRELHRRWLASLYDFAGELRSVDLSKGRVRFAPVVYLSSTLRALDDTMTAYSPCAGMSEARLIEAIATVHIELVLSHPFREGNGRLARWVADLMALQAGERPLDWGFPENVEVRREDYFAALRRGFAGDVKPLGLLVAQALDRSHRSGADPFAPP